jgi:hypothetical protein
MKDDAINASAFLLPDGVLRLPVKHAQHPVMAGKIGEIPRHGSIRLPQRVGAIDQSDIVKLGTSNAFGLHDSEQPASCKSRSVSGGRRRSSSVFEARSRNSGIRALARATMAT